jgi:hypothetical protein
MLRARFTYFPLHFHFCLSQYETQYPITAIPLDSPEQNGMSNFCAAIRPIRGFEAPCLAADRGF